MYLSIHLLIIYYTFIIAVYWGVDFYSSFPLIQICPLVSYQIGDCLPLQWVSHPGPCSQRDLSVLFPLSGLPATLPQF